jgi:predicted nuclease of predicted toxin-antitoxin system
VKFLIDEMFGPDVAAELNALGHEAIPVYEANLGNTDDGAVLMRAIDEQRVLVTENAQDSLRR